MILSTIIVSAQRSDIYSDSCDTQGGGGAGAGGAGRQASASLNRSTWRAEDPEEGLESVPQARTERATEGESISFRLSLPGALLEDPMAA